MAKSADWSRIGLSQWFDCKLGTMSDERLGRLTGVKTSRIRYRRELFRIDPWSTSAAIEPYKDILGVRSNAHIARLAGVSAASVKIYREAQGIPRRVKPKGSPRIPLDHPVWPYRSLIGLVDNKTLASVSGVSVRRVANLLAVLKVEEGPSAPRALRRKTIPNYQGPWLGFESLLGSMSVTMISRTVGVPYNVVEKRRKFLGIPPFQRTTRLTQYEHLLEVASVPPSVLGKIVGLSASRVSELRRKKMR